MNKAANLMLGWLMILCLATAAAQTAPAPSSNAPKTEGPEVSYQLFVFQPSYRFVSTSGYPGRVGEYESLQQSVGGDLSLTWLDYTGHTSLKSRSSIISRDDYDVDTQFRLGNYFSFGMNNRSFLRHLDNVPFGTNLDEDATIRTSFIPDGALFGVKRTNNTVNARLKVPKTPLTLIATGGWQARRGSSQMQFFDMGNQTNPQILPPDPESCDGSCHSTARYRHVNYTTRNVGGGVEMKVSHVVLTYIHEFRSFNDRLQNPVDYYGTAASVDGESLPPRGPQPGAPPVPDTLQGFYVHNVLSRHGTQIDMLRAHAPITQSLTFNGNLSYGRTQNLYTNNPQNSFNADATLNWNPTNFRKLRTIVDYHQQNTLNEFTPSFFTLFGNPSLHRFWMGVRTEYSVTPRFDVEVHYRRTDVTRSNAGLWPQFYSVGSVGLVGSPADAFVPRLVPSTFSNTAGFGVKFHRGETWNLHSGYEWIGTHAPGYLTDPQTSQRVFAGGVFTPKPWVSFAEDFSVLRQSDFQTATQQPFPRSNRLYLNTSYVTLKPVQDWSLGVGYAYYQNNLKTDLMFGTDPFYLDPFVPFKSISQSYSISSTYLMKKKLAWNVELAHVASSSSLRPNLSNAPICDAGPVPLPCADSVIFASQFSTVSVPQALASSTLDYRWRGGYDSGLRFQYGSYKDQVHPELNGHLNTYGLFFGKTW
jgi:hypothetical protein